MAASAEVLIVGKSFSSFTEVENAIDAYQQAKGVQLWRRDARTIESAKMRVSRHLSDQLKYYDVRYCCIHGGRKFSKRGLGIRDTS